MNKEQKDVAEFHLAMAQASAKTPGWTPPDIRKILIAQGRTPPPEEGTSDHEHH